LATISIPERKTDLCKGARVLEGTGKLLSRCPSAVELALFLTSFNYWYCICVGRVSKWSTQLRRERWVATGLSQWLRYSDLQGSARYR